MLLMIASTALIGIAAGVLGGSRKLWLVAAIGLATLEACYFLATGRDSFRDAQVRFYATIALASALNIVAVLFCQKFLSRPNP